MHACVPALEKLLKDHAGKYATGDDFFLVSITVSFLWCECVCMHACALHCVDKQKLVLPLYWVTAK